MSDYCISNENIIYWNTLFTFIHSFIHSLIQTISIAPLQVTQVHHHSEALPTQQGYCAGISRRSATGNCELRTCPRYLRGGKSGSRTHDLSDERRRLYQCTTHAPHRPFSNKTPANSPECSPMDAVTNTPKHHHITPVLISYLSQRT